MTPTRMRQELLETPERLAQQFSANADTVAAIAADLARRPRARWYVAGRGSSAHAGALFAAAAGRQLDQIVSRLPLSMVTVYGRRPAFADCFMLSISQSGAGEDINTAMRGVCADGGLGVALTNHPESELAAVASYCLDLHMGPEKAVAATKTFLGTLAASAQLVAAVAGDRALTANLQTLPDALAAAVDDPAIDAEVLAGFDRAAFVIGRGVGLSIAREIALKFKEVCVLPAEPFSAAEFRHGPLTLVKAGTPILVVCLDDETRPQLLETAAELAGLGASVVLIGPDLPSRAAAPNLRVVSLPAGGNIYVDAVALAFRVYDLLERRSVALGLDPDQPPHVRKVTSTY